MGKEGVQIMATRAFALILAPNVPEELLLTFDGYVDHHRGLNMIFCRKPSYDGYFVSVEIIKLDKSDTNTWEVQIPLGFVLTIVDASRDRPSIGFCPGDR